MDLRQGNRSVSAYAVEFRSLATDSGWNDESLFDAFMRGLADYIRDHLTAIEMPKDLDSLIALVNVTTASSCERERPKQQVYPLSQRGPATDSRLSWRSPVRFGPAAASPKALAC